MTECRTCHRVMRDYLKGYEDYCYRCGCEVVFVDMLKESKDADEVLSLDRALVAGWRDARV